MQKDEQERFSQAVIVTLKHERKARGLSHEVLAKKAGLSRQAIGKIETGITRPTLLTLYKLTKAMNMTLEEFVREIK